MSFIRPQTGGQKEKDMLNSSTNIIVILGNLFFSRTIFTCLENVIVGFLSKILDVSRVDWICSINLIFMVWGWSVNVLTCSLSFLMSQKITKKTTLNPCAHTCHNPSVKILTIYLDILWEYIIETTQARNC